MSLRIIRPGLQTTLQGSTRAGFRHFGVPWSGPADSLSLSLANRLVGGEADHLAFEVTLTGLAIEFETDLAFAVTGARCEVSLSGKAVELHQTHFAAKGDVLEIGPTLGGCRTYLAVSGKIEAKPFLGSASTYLNGGFGGLNGKALGEGARVPVGERWKPEPTETPFELRPHFNDKFLLQAVLGPDFGRLSETSRKNIFSQEYSATQRASRMGLELKGQNLSISDEFSKASSAVFPGTVQCPPNGNPFILLADAQTTGGYPHILQVIRSDRFQLGQIKPGAGVRFVERSAEDAMERYRSRLEAYRLWLADPII